MVDQEVHVDAAALPSRLSQNSLSELLFTFSSRDTVSLKYIASMLSSNGTSWAGALGLEEAGMKEASNIGAKAFPHTQVLNSTARLIKNMQGSEEFIRRLARARHEDTMVLSSRSMSSLDQYATSNFQNLTTLTAHEVG
ncbi:hypothetical protein WG66_002404 [Moniliophthora roreri]|nr:hypothetical protein WG66_002404 [Moniliophthora roreri]